MNNLGKMYGDGKGVAKDGVEAVRLYRQAADLCNARAMAFLGSMYANGRGVAKDEAAPVRLYRHSADLGNTLAMRNLGRVYENGLGVTKDIGEAKSYYQKAAEQSGGAGILVGLCAFALDHDPEPIQSRHRRHGPYPRASRLGPGPSPMDARKQRRARIQATLRGSGFDAANVCGRSSWHRRPGISRLGSALPSHARNRPRPPWLCRQLADLDLPGELFHLIGIVR